MTFRRYAGLTLAYNLAVIVWGAFVRASGSGAGCGRHWPLCNGTVLQKSPRLETIIELVHRTTSGLALVAVLVLFVWARRRFAAGHLARRAAVFSLIFIVTEAAVGAGLVLLELVAGNDSMLRAGYLAVHLTNTFLLIGSLTLATIWGGERRPVPRAAGSDRDRRWIFGVALALIAVGISGAITALGDTLFPAASLAAGLEQDRSATAHLLLRLRVIHPIAAGAAGIAAILGGWRLTRRIADERLARWAATVTGLVLVQWVAGTVNLLLLAPVALQLVHLVLADLVWLAWVAVGAHATTTAERT
ncbi:MAG: COX15/CtaA family protein [Gemmatimonadota bacterium]